ncbi:uncharacterized protein LOC135374571 [Ornithodoros turicata]|uniref:uncharacterized protein LOC135374571 n=1 Tax=Ornithodoros turicata TaxID=34597 RepID=UPI00313903C2
MSGKMNLFMLGRVLTDTDTTVSWIHSKDLLPNNMNCPRCGRELSVKPSQRTFGQFRCRHGHAQFSQSVTVGTWFENMRLAPEQVLILTYCFAKKMTFQQALDEASMIPEVSVSSATVADWYSYCREVCTDSLANVQTQKIGGPGHVVEIDECKIGRRKYQRGRIVEGTWILGLIDVDTKQLCLEICLQNKRDKETLLALIDKHVEKGTTLYTDCWKGYAGLSAEGFQHMMVNHTYNFVDPDTGVTTNHIESQWRPLRHRLARGGVTSENMAHHLSKYLWRTDCSNKNEQPFERLLNDIKSLYSPQQGS